MARELGLPEIPLDAGDHVCGFYYGDQERDAILLPFLRSGLRAGDRCLAVVDSTPLSRVVLEIGDGLDVDDALASGQLQLYDSDQTYLRTGEFDADLMIRFWEEQASTNSADARFTFARVLGEMSWLSRVPPRREQVVRYESWADGFASKFPHAVLCLYDLSRLGSGILLDLLRTHPKILLGGLVLENPHHISVDEFAAVQP